MLLSNLVLLHVLDLQVIHNNIQLFHGKNRDWNYFKICHDLWSFKLSGEIPKDKTKTFINPRQQI